MTPLRIAMVGHTALGGSGVVAAQLAAHLCEAGHTVHVLSHGEPVRVANGPRRPTFHRVEAPDYPVFDVPPLALAMASAIARQIDEAALDVVHVHYAVPYAVSARLALEIAHRRVRLVVTLHGSDVTGVGRHPMYLPAIRAALRHASAITVPSEALAGAARGLLGLPSDVPLTVVPNFVDPARFRPADGAGSPPERPLTLLHMSNFRPVKRVDRLVELLQRVRAELDARLLLVGDGPEQCVVAEAFEAAGLSAHVRFLGVLADPAPVLRESDVFVQPSAMESFGLAALEAMSTAVPVVATRVGGVSEVVEDGVTGLLVPADSPDELAAATLRLLRDPALRQQMGQAGRERAMRVSSPARAVRGYLAAYTGNIDPSEP